MGFGARGGGSKKGSNAMTLVGTKTDWKHSSIYLH